MVVKEHEISLNSVRYPLKGQVRPVLSSKFAEKQVIGDYTKDSDPYTSKWVISDLRDGMLSEEMDEERHQRRSWWTTCDTRFKSSTTLPPLATLLTAPTVSTGYLTPNGFEDPESVWTDDAKAYDENTGTYAYDNIGAGDTWNDWLVIKTSDACYCDKVRVWSERDNALINKIQVEVYYSGAWTSIFNSTISAVGEYVEYAIGSTQWVTQMRIKYFNDSPDNAHEARLVEAAFNRAAWVEESANQFVNYFDSSGNAVTYTAYGHVLGKLNAGHTGYDYVNAFVATITALFHDGTNLYVFLGDSEQYVYLDTSDTIVLTTDATHGIGATKGIYWDSKVFRMDSAGEIFLLTDPATTTPVSATKGKLPIADNSVQTLFTYRDADGDDIIYAATTEGLWAHDYANAKWIETELKTPNHPTSGKGAGVWRDACYVSAGLHVDKYIAAETASIQSVGLDLDDGLPQLRSGEIVKFIIGYNEMFALVDSTYEGSTSRSQVARYDGRGWTCWWEATADNKNAYSGIVSDDGSYYLLFGITGGVYSIPLQRTSQQPKKVSGYTYATAGVLVSPWFDANWQVGNKLAIQLVTAVRDASANETVVVKYRVNHATTALAATWTTASTITSDGETTYTFGSSLGTAVRSIQFRIELASTSDNTKSPVLEYARLTYEKVIPKRWGWRFSVDCTQTYGGKSPDQLLDAIVTAAELETLVPFVYKSTTYYVRIAEVSGQRLTGDGKQGEYEIFVVEPI